MIGQASDSPLQTVWFPSVQTVTVVKVEEMQTTPKCNDCHAWQFNHWKIFVPNKLFKLCTQAGDKNIW